MMSLNPLLLVGGVIGTVSVLLLIAYACVKDKKTAMGFERSMACLLYTSPSPRDRG